MFRLFGFAGATFSGSAVMCWFLVAYDDYHLVPIHSLLAIVCFALFFLSGGTQAIFSLTGKKNIGYATRNSLYFLLTTALLVLLNVAASRKEFFYFDSTEQQVYTLAPQSKEVLAKLSQPLQMKLFTLGGLVEPKIQNLLNRVCKESPLLTWSIVDPERNPTQIERFGITEANTLHFEYKTPIGTSVRKLSAAAVDEQSIINSIIRLTTGGPKKVYFLSGHQEPDLTSLEKSGYRFFAEALEGENFEVKTLLLEDGKPIAEDADLLIVAAPQSELIDFEQQAIFDYLNKGGKLLVLHEPRTSSTTTQIAKQLGITIGDNLVVDSFVQLFSNPGFGLEPVVTNFSKHPVTEKFSSKVFFSTVSSVMPTKEDDPAITILAQSSNVSWAETNLELLLGDSGEAEKTKDDISGPVPLVVAWEKDSKQVDGAKAIVFGDSDLAANLHFRKAGNRDLLLNAANWLIGETAGITLRAKTLRTSIQPITAEQINKMFIATAIIIPELVLLAGLVFWWRRRSKT